MSRINDAVGQGKGDQSGSAVENLKDKAEQIGQNVREIGGNLRDAAKAEYGHLRDQAGEYYEQGREKAQQWEEGIERYVQEKPIQALLMAAGVGLILGILWKRS